MHDITCLIYYLCGSLCASQITSDFPSVRTRIIVLEHDVQRNKPDRQACRSNQSLVILSLPSTTNAMDTDSLLDFVYSSTYVVIILKMLYE